MYSVDEKDSVVPLAEVPQSDPGAPMPFVMCDEHTVLLAYFVFQKDPNWDGTYVQIRDPESPQELISLINFEWPKSHIFGPPNDEAFSGHPLASRGLRRYSAAEVKHSSWIRRLERMNSVHHRHNPAWFDKYRHFIFAFHDSTFECVAKGLQVSVHKGPMSSVLTEMKKLLGWSA
jgi:hypothetical protein